MNPKIELQSTGKVLDFTVLGIHVSAFYTKLLEHGYWHVSVKGKRLEMNMPGTHEGFLHLSIGWKPRFLFIVLRRVIKVAIKII